jgi:iron complex transport system substrate-binding protein
MVVCMSILALTACSGSGGRKEVTVTDGMGNEVVLKGKPERIVSLTLASDEILLELVEKEKIRALSYLSEDQGLSNVAHMVDGIDKLGTNLEEVIAAQPDLVFVADWTDADFISQLNEANIPVYVIATPGSMDEIKETITGIASALGEEKRGKELIDRMQERLDAVNKKVSTLEESERFTVLSIDSFYYTYGTGTTFDIIASHAGVVNLAAAAGIQMWGQLSKEQVVEMNPDIILLPSWSYEGFDAEKYAEEFKGDKALETVKAVQNGKVLMLPEKHMTTFSHYIALGVEDLAKAAYPQLFPEE